MSVCNVYSVSVCNVYSVSVCNILNIFYFVAKKLPKNEGGGSGQQRVGGNINLNGSHDQTHEGGCCK